MPRRATKSYGGCMFSFDDKWNYNGAISSDVQTLSRVAIGDLVSDRSLPHWEAELSLNCTRSKDTTSCIQNSTCQPQPYGLKVACEYATISDPNQPLLDKQPYFLSAPVITLDKQLMEPTVTLQFFLYKPPPFWIRGHNSSASFFKINFYWSIVDLQCCVSFRCTAKWISYAYTYIHSFLDSIPI